MTVQIHNSRFERIQQKAEPVVSHLVELLKQGYAISVAVSFGKDSSVLLVLFFEALRCAKAEGVKLPNCYISHSNTGIENPAMDSYTGEMIRHVENFIEKHNFPVEIVLAEPSLSGSFMYATVGRGKLPRFVDSKHRECSIDWKIKPQQKALKRIRKQAGEGQDLVVLVGTRSSESASRSERMQRAGHTATALIPEEGQPGLYSNAPIADWEMTDVWELLMASDSERNGIYLTYVPNFEQTLELYKSANEGMCAVIVGDGGNRASCGSRFGCGICTIAGKKDKSMTAMIESEPEIFGYLDGINRLRDFLVRTQHDFSRREWFQRGISEVGYVALSPDNYSSTMRRQILRYMITLDVKEAERAEEHDAALFRGDIPSTKTNRRLAHPQFEWITPKMLVAIDFAWGIYGSFQHAFPALREWYEIVHLGRRYDIPEVSDDEYPRIPVPEKRYFHVGASEHSWKIEGLRNIYGEAFNPSRRPDRPPFGAYKDKDTGETLRVTYFEEDSELSIDDVEANLFLSEFEDLYFDMLTLENYDGVRYLLDRGLVKVGRGQIAAYDKIARRSQQWLRLQRDLNVYDIQRYATDHAISKEEHFRLLQEHQREKAEQGDHQFNLDVFSEQVA